LGLKWESLLSVSFPCWSTAKDISTFIFPLIPSFHRIKTQVSNKNPAFHGPYVPIGWHEDVKVHFVWSARLHQHISISKQLKEGFQVFSPQSSDK
jgi:hypothetical protein